ncbi:MAG: DUF1822 family protein [Dolichospermum sp. UKL201]|jgi:hypothetical protein|nr:MAG: DUF1822 family protein [Dolichospermum sp. UKL201]
MNINFNQIKNQNEVIMQNIEELKNFYPDHQWIEISEQDKEEAEANTRCYANQTGRNYAFVNYLCHKVFSKWVKEYQEIESNNKVFSSDNNLARIWQFINGSVVNIHDKRLILIPSDATDLEGFEVQQEWVDIPNLAGDYYLPVRVDLERNYLHIWGFISRKNLQKRADYDKLDKLYIVSSGDVIDDIETLWIALELYEEKGDFEALPSLTESEAAKLIKTYSQPLPYSPRLKGNSQEWMALLNEKEWVKNLDLEMLIKSPDRPLAIFLEQSYQKESANVKTQPTIKKQEKAIYRSGLPIPSKIEKHPKIRTKPTREKQEKAIYRSGLPIPSKIEKHRGFSVYGVILDTEEKIDRAIKNLLAKSVQEIVPENLEREDILLDLLLNGKQEISGQAAEIFWAIASCLPSPKTREIHTKEIEISGHLLLANIAFIKAPSQRIAVLLRVHSQLPDSLLPNGLTLQWMFPDDQGNYILEGTPAVADKQNCIQLYFCADWGDNCAFQIKMGHKTSVQGFIV